MQGWERRACWGSTGGQEELRPASTDRDNPGMNQTQASLQKELIFDSYKGPGN